MKGPIVCIAYILGCPRSVMDTAALHEYFVRNGYIVTNDFRKADLVLCSTCGVDLRTEAISIKYLEIVDRKRDPHSKLIVIGCLAGINTELLKSKFDAILIPPRSLDKLDEIIDAKIKFSEIKDSNVIKPIMAKSLRSFGLLHRFHGPREFIYACIRKALAVSGLGRVLAATGCIRNVKSNLEPVGDIFSLRVARGCMNDCTFCAIRFAAGPLRSKSLADILAEFESGLEQGYKEFRVIAGDVGCYGQDIDLNVVDLFRSILSRKGNYRLTIFDFNPRWFCKYASELTTLFSENSKRVNMLMLPVQSGSDRILKLMHRDYTSSELKNCIGSLRSAAPDILISTHAIVGFPGETEEDHAKTFDLLENLRFDKVDVYKYADRPRTPASLLPDKVPQATIEYRAAQLKKRFH